MPRGYTAMCLFWVTDCKETRYYFSFLLHHLLVLQIVVYGAKEEGIHCIKRQHVGDLEAGIIGKMVGNQRIRGLEEIQCLQAKSVYAIPYGSSYNCLLKTSRDRKSTASLENWFQHSAILTTLVGFFRSLSARSLTLRFRPFQSYFESGEHNVLPFLFITFSVFENMCPFVF